MAKSEKNRTFKFFIYGILLFVAFIVQASFLIFGFFGAYPNLVLALILAIAMFENDFTAAMFGLGGGIFVDMISTNGNGVHALSYMLLALFASLLYENYYQKNFLSLFFVHLPIIVINEFIEIISKGGLSKAIFTMFIYNHYKVAIFTFIFIFIDYLIFAHIINKDEKFQKPVGILPNSKENKL